MNGKPRVLYITHRVPYPPDKGDRIRNWNVLRQLAENCFVDLATLRDEPLEEWRENICSIEGVRSIFSVHTSRNSRIKCMIGSIIRGRSLSEGNFHEVVLQHWIEEQLQIYSYDAIVLSASSLRPYLVHPKLRNTPTFFDVVDVDSQKWFDFADSSRGPKRSLYRFEGSRIRELERDIATWANTITLVSDAETKLFNDIVERDVAITATNGVDLAYFCDKPAAQPREGTARLACAAGLSLAFVGAMDYLPNIDAVQWFVREVWPGILTKHPNAGFRIIGRNPTAAVRKLADARGVTVSGSVPDVRPLIVDATVVVVPMRLGRGLQNKVLEALAMGKAVIASPPALAALKAVPGRDLLQATTPREWIDAVTQLIDDEPRRRELGAMGRYVEEHHDWETCLKPLIDRVLAACRVEVPA